MQELVNCLVAGNFRLDCGQWLIFQFNSHSAAPYGLTKARELDSAMNYFESPGEAMEYAKKYFAPFDIREHVEPSMDCLCGRTFVYPKEIGDAVGTAKELQEMESRFLSAKSQCELIRSERDKCVNQIEYMRDEFRDMKKQRDICQKSVTDLSDAITSVRAEYWEKHAECRKLTDELKNAWNLIKNEEENSKYWKDKFDRLTEKQLDT